MPDQYSDKQIQQIKEYAGYLMTPLEIARLLGIDSHRLTESIQNEETSASKAYYMGKTETALAIRKQEVELAKIGSPVAVEHTSRYLLNMDLEEDG